MGSVDAGTGTDFKGVLKIATTLVCKVEDLCETVNDDDDENENNDSLMMKVGVDE